MQLYAFEASFEEIIEGVTEATEERKEGESRVSILLSTLYLERPEGELMIVENSFLARGMRREGKKWKCLGLELMDLVEEGEGEGEEGEEGMMIGEVGEDDTRDRVWNGSFAVGEL